MEAKRPSNEQARLRALYELDILDSSAEATWNRIVELATKLYDVPISLVTLVTEDRQWFKAKIGLTIDATSRESAFCAHAILKPETLVVTDAAKDKRFADNPLVTGEPKIRFYAGAPIHHPDGSALGTVCIIDRRPRKFTKIQIEGLRSLADQAEELLAYRLAAVKLRHTLSGPPSKQSQDFLNNASHLLNTPLTPILLRLEMLQNSLAGDSEKSKIVEDTKRNMRDMQNAIQVFLRSTSGIDEPVRQEAEEEN